MSARRSPTGYGFDHRLEPLQGSSPARCSGRVSIVGRCSEPAVVTAACSFTNRSGRDGVQRRDLCDYHARSFCHLHHIDRAILETLAASAMTLPVASSAAAELAPPSAAPLPTRPPSAAFNAGGK